MPRLTDQLFVGFSGDGIATCSTYKKLCSSEGGYTAVTRVLCEIFNSDEVLRARVFQAVRTKLGGGKKEVA